MGSCAIMLAPSRTAFASCKRLPSVGWRDSARRLRLAKRAAKDVIRGGGSAQQAAAAAQAFGMPCEDDTSDASGAGTSRGRYR